MSYNVPIQGAPSADGDAVTYDDTGRIVWAHSSGAASGVGDRLLLTWDSLTLAASGNVNLDASTATVVETAGTSVVVDGSKLRIAADGIYVLSVDVGYNASADAAGQMQINVNPEAGKSAFLDNANDFATKGVVASKMGGDLFVTPPFQTTANTEGNGIGISLAGSGLSAGSLSVFEAMVTLIRIG